MWLTVEDWKLDFSPLLFFSPFIYNYMVGSPLPFILIMYTFYIDSVHKTTLGGGGGGGTSLLHVLGCSVTEDTANTSFLNRCAAFM